MIYVLIILFATALLLSLKYYITKLSVLMSSMVLSMSGLVFSALMFVAKSDKYIYIDSPIAKFDHYLFLKINSLLVSHSTIVIIANISLMCYFASMLLYNYLYYHNQKNSKRFLNAISVYCFISIIFYIIFYHPKTSYFIYIITNKESYIQYRALLKSVVYSLDILNYINLVIFCITPISTAIRYYRYTFSSYKKKQIISTTICITMLNILCITLLLFLPFRRPYIMQPPEAILGITLPYRVPSMIFITCSFVYPAAIIGFIYIVIHHKLINTSNFSRLRFLRKNVYKINKSMIEVFHMFKNIVFRYKISVANAINCGSPEQTREILTELENQMNEFINSSTKIMSINNSIEIELCTFDILELLDECLSVAESKGYHIKKIYYENRIDFLGDAFYIKDVFNNIVKNAMEATDKAERELKEISVTALFEYEWIIIQISDKGCGINKKDLKNVFHPMFSTKSSATNWGVGLSFVSKIIKMHRGQIYINSKEGVGTDVTVLLPKNSKL